MSADRATAPGHLFARVIRFSVSCRAETMTLVYEGVDYAGGALRETIVTSRTRDGTRVVSSRELEPRAA